MKEKKARVEDALHATRAAVEEGILPGGGVALLRASTASSRKHVSDDDQIGYNIVCVRAALRSPRSPTTPAKTAASSARRLSKLQRQLRLQRGDRRCSRTW